MDYAEPAAMLPGLVVQAIQACADRRHASAVERALKARECIDQIILWAREQDAPLVKLGPEE